MRTRAPKGSCAGNCWYRLASGRAWFGVLAAAALGLAGLAQAQAPPAATLPAGESAPTLSEQLAGIPGVEPAMTPDQLIDVALEAAQAERLDDAQKILFAIGKQYQQNLRALQALGYVYELYATMAKANIGDPNAERTARRYLDAAVTTYLYAAPLAMDDGDLQAARQMYNTVLIHRPTNPDAQLGLARVLHRSERSREAVQRYRAYIKNPTARPDLLAQAYLELGQIYRAQRYLHLAVATLEKARSLNPESPEILVELAVAYQDSNKPDKALALLESATSRAPDNAAYCNVYAVILLAQSRPRGHAPANAEDARRSIENARVQARKALDLTRESLRDTPDDQELLMSLNQYYGTYRQALSAIVVTDPANTGARLELVRAIREQAAVVETMNLHLALEVLEQAGDQAQQSIPFLEKLAELQFDVYKRKAAAETCRRLLKLDARNAVARRILRQIEPQAKTDAAGPEG